MFIVVELIFIILLIAVLFMLYGNDRLTAKNSTPKAKVEEYWSGKERRKHVRFKNTMEIHYVVKKKPFLSKNARTEDISEGGIRIVLGEKLAKGVILELRIPIPNLSRTQNVEGEVMWSEELQEKHPSGKRLFASGIKFRALEDRSDKTLFTYIRSLPSSASGENRRPAGSACEAGMSKAPFPGDQQAGK